MIILNLDLNAGTLKLSQTTVVKYGSVIPVQVVFATAPGTVTGIELALGDDSSTPTVRAFTDVFNPDSDTMWSGTLSTLTDQMLTLLNGKASVAVNAELTVIVDGDRMVLPNVSLTVQQLINNGAAAVTAGQSYYTKTEIDGLLAGYVLSMMAGKWRFNSNGLEVWNPTQNKWQTVAGIGAAGAETLAFTIDNS